MNRKRRRKAALLLAVAVALGFPCASGAAGPKVAARAAALLEMNSGKVMFTHNAHERLPMASTTKIMTAILAIERCDLGEMVTTPKEAYGTEGSSMYLKLHEVVCMEDLLYGLMLSSGNDAAVAIAVHVGGSVEGFARLMNEKAAELGLSNTHFVTPNGLHDDAHYTTAYELARIAAYAMQNETFRTIVGTQSYRTSTGDHVRTLQNRNKTLWQYDGGNGVKTGYTSKAGKCLVFAAEQDGMQLVGVVLHTPDTYGDAYALLDHGFSHYAMQSVVRAGDRILWTAAEKGVKNGLDLLAAKDIMIPVAIGETASFRSQISVAEWIIAPVRAGDAYGWLSIWEDGRLMGKCALVAAEDVAQADFGYYFARCLAGYLA